MLDESFDQWKVPQSAHDYANHFDAEWRRDVEALVSKDYNHPCVIMYCIGNEITDTGFPHGAVISKMLSDAFHELDDTRPTTIAINSMLSMLANMQAKKKMEVEKAANEAKERKASGEEEIIAQKAEGDKAVGSQEVNDIVALLPKIMASITPESLEALIGECVKNVDIVGYNYGHNLYEGTHELVKERVILSSETFRSVWQITGRLSCTTPMSSVISCGRHGIISERQVSGFRHTEQIRHRFQSHIRVLQRPVVLLI